MNTFGVFWFLEQVENISCFFWLVSKNIVKKNYKVKGSKTPFMEVDVQPQQDLSDCQDDFIFLIILNLT